MINLRILAFALCAAAFGQVPSIGGIVNAASGVNSDSGHFGLVPGSLATIFGTNLSQATQAVTSTPLPTMLAGVRVTVGNIFAPLLYVSPAQINFQIPNDTIYLLPARGFMSTPVVVRSIGVSTSGIELADMGSGIFTINGSGCGPGATQNVSGSGQVTLNSSANSAEPGQFVSIFGTGFGLVVPEPADGVPAPTAPQRLELVGGALFEDTG